jgi:ABC-type multidrug transport system fused ATPase/permease subunit
MENEEKKEFANIEIKVKNIVTKDFQFFSYINMAMDTSLVILTVASFYILYNAKIKETMNNENIVTAMIMISHLVSYLSNFSRNYMNIIDAIGYSKESDKFMDEINQKVVSPYEQVPVTMDTYKGAIVFKNVSFSYAPGKLVLKNVSMRINPLTKIAIYGKSGSGKSTIMKLLLGFYGLTDGNITIGGIDIRMINVDELRKGISVVNQTVKLFDKTIIENILYGNTAITDENRKIIDTVVNSAIFSNIKDPMNTPVGISGSKLSGGQKQIINLLRAIAKNSPILLLDEPTSSLDSDSKELVMKLLSGIKDKTIIIITHDRSIMRFVDRVYELKEGVLT